MGSPWLRHRLPMGLAASLDGAALVLLALLLNGQNGHLDRQRGLLGLLILTYCSLGWLFGSYSVLRMPRLRWRQLVVRLALTSSATVAAAALLSWLARVPPQVSLLHRSNLIPMFALVTAWSAVVRLLLRSRWQQQNRPRWKILALAEEADQVAREWLHTPTRESLPPITMIAPGCARFGGVGADAVALTAGVAADPEMQIFCQEAVSQGQPVSAIAEMAEQELQRIPPRWVGNQWLLFSNRISGQRTTLEQQLKRYADVVISLVLLLITTPLLLLGALLVRLQDGGPVLFRQRRTGLLGQTFEVLKIRTMVPDAESGEALWALPRDNRITPVGIWLRRTRIDELPQLINVLRGEMSLIGPRPERPELESTLEARIPNYRLRHWIRPGLSGWAQVNMPYGASVEDSELKLSYDLFYLRNCSFWLDLLILAKTIKIVLKGAGR